MRNLTIPSRRTRTSCSVLALATVLVVGATPAAAQSFLGSGTFTNNGGGGASITTAPNLTTITVNPGSTVIDWIPTDNAVGGGSIAFQNNGTTANFLGAGNYAVLNRINPADSTRSVTMNGIINTRDLQGAASNGSLYFYTPGGFVIGANARINVGSLVLSASPITVDGSGNFINGASNTVTFGQAGRANAQISVASGAQINALYQGSYVAMVAPSIVHNGTVTVNGSAALVAAEAATISFSPDGLFDIQVTSGTTSTFGISTAGEIIGSASSGAGDNHRIHLVAVPKNQAMLMLIGAGADLGFDVAGAANVEGNAIVLSGGHDVVDGAIGAVSSGSNGTGIANLDLRDSNFTSALISDTTGFSHFSGFSALHFYSDVTAHADGAIWFSTQGVGLGTVDVNGNLTLSTERFGPDGANVTTSNIDVYTSGGGRITVDGSTNLNSDAYGGSSETAGTAGGNGTAGRAWVTAYNNGFIELVGGLSASANGYGGSALGAGINGGRGTGGSVVASANGPNSHLTIDGGATVSAGGFGGSSGGEGCQSCNGVGGAGTGGSIQFSTSSGAAGTELIVNGDIIASAEGRGGDGNIASGTGTGGLTSSTYATASTITLNGSVNFSAIGYGGSATAGPGATGQGGRVILGGQTGAIGSLTVTGNVTSDVSGFGGSAFGGGTGGLGRGGQTDNGGSAGDVNFQSDFTGFAAGYGGSSQFGTGGEAIGGRGWVEGFGAAVQIGGNYSMNAGATGGTGETGGNATGGLALLQATAGSAVTVAGDVLVDSSASGGAANVADGIGGNATGGTARIQAGTGSSIDIDGSVDIDADGIGGEVYAYFGGGGTGGNGTGGTAHLITTGGTLNVGTEDAGDTVDVTADGEGGFAFGGTGGNGTGGVFAEIAAIDGDITIDGYAFVSASGEGGDGLFGGNGRGSGDTSNPDQALWTGGAHIFARNGDIVITGGAGVYATGTGGAGDTEFGYGGDFGGDGGDGLGGWASIHAANGAGGQSAIRILTGTSEGSGFAEVSADGTGGDGGNGRQGDFGNDGDNGASGPVGAGGGAGGTGGAGGSGGAGGAGIGGVSAVTAASDNGRVDISQVYASAQGFGGDGGDAGDGGQGGFGGLGGNGSAGAGGNGGNGGNGGAGGLGGVGGSGTAGYATVGTESGTNAAFGLGIGQANYGTVTIIASAVGGVGGSGGDAGAAGLGGSGGTGTTAGAAGVAGLGGAAGNGGNGGRGRAGAATLLVRGSLLSVDDVTLQASATGGNGGLGGDGANLDPDGADGVGGPAIIGGEGLGIGVLATGRFQLATQRGSLTAGTINGSAFATGGIGSTNGPSGSFGQNGIFFSNADGSIGSLNFVVDAVGPGAGAIPDLIVVRGGTVDIDNGLSFITSGNLSLFADNGDLTADTINWQAANFVADVQYGSPSVEAGTFSANSFTISTEFDFITTANLDSVAALTIVAPNGIEIGNVTSGSDIVLDAQGGGIAIGNVAGAGIDLQADDAVNTGDIDGDGTIAVDAGSSIGIGAITNSGNTSLFAGMSINVGAIDSGGGAVSLITGTSSIDGDSVAGGSIIADSGDDLFLGDLTAPGDIEVVAAGDIVIGDATAGAYIDLDAGGDIDGGNMTAGASIYATAFGSVELLDISAGIVDPELNEGVEYNVGILAGSTIDTGDIAALDSIGLGALDDISTGDIDAGNIFLALGGGDMSFGSITADGATYLADASMIELGGDPTEGDFDPIPILTAAPVASGGSIAIGGPVFTGNFEASAGTTLTSASITSDNLISAQSGGDMSLGDLFADNDIQLTSGGNLIAGSVESNDDIGIVADGSIETEEMFAYDDIGVDAGTTISTDDITGNTIDLLAGGAISTGDLTTGEFIIVENQLAPGASITVNAGGAITTGDIDSRDGVALFGASITAGNIVADDGVGLFTPGDLAVGTIASGADVVALVGDDATFGAITTPGRFFLGGYELFDLVGDGEDYDPTVVFDSDDTSSTGGSATFAGSSSVESFQSYAGEDTTIASLTAPDFIDLDTGGLLSINGTISGGYITLLSSDIVIGQSAQIDAPDGISFISLNSVGTYIGDNIPGDTGYRLAQAEVDRVDANQLEFEVATERGAAGLMRLGDLDLTISPDAGDDGNVEFSISSEDEEGATGVIRVVGDVSVSLGGEQMVEFETETFEIDAATGSVALTDTLGALGGILSLEASNIFIASGDILTRLEANPQYEGFRNELNAPAAVQRPEGVVRAAIVTLGQDAVDLDNILIQNTGTTDVPAGFLVDVLTFEADDEDELPPALGSINMVINGQVQTESGTVTGVAVRDGLVAEFGAELIGVFVAGSTINGCALTGSCGSSGPTPPIATITPSDVQITNPNGLGDGLFGNESDIDDGESGDEGDRSSPIAAPVPLFDSRPLGAEGDIDDPISGAGNPSLIGTSEEEIETCDSSRDGNCKPANKGDGQ